jgi:7-cyano-7-deazaguanine synthase in queuosine biosynthesis
MDCLHRCLKFLSEDYWQIDLVSSPYTLDLGQLSFSSDWKPLAEDPIVCLYSGGLDSAAGLVRRISEYGDHKIAPVLVAHQKGQRPLVQRQLKVMSHQTKVTLKPLVLPFLMQNPKKLGRAEEPTQRSRSFLFCAAAGVMAAMIEAQSIEMMESGIGAINLPLMAGMVGSKATRNSHPAFLSRFSQLLQLVTDRDFHIDLPHLYLTKAELVRSLRLANLEKLAMDTVSCIHYPLRESKAKQCGVCSACIFRRQAVAASGIDEPEGQYKYELLGRKSNEIPGNKLDDLRAFLLQVDKLSSLDYSDQLPPCAMRHLRSTEVITDNRIPAELVSLYRRYRQEWLAFIECGCKKGWEWTGMMVPTSAE